jgi:hypothetical protein
MNDDNTPHIDEADNSVYDEPKRRRFTLWAGSMALVLVTGAGGFVIGHATAGDGPAAGNTSQQGFPGGQPPGSGSYGQMPPSGTTGTTTTT